MPRQEIEKHIRRGVMAGAVLGGAAGIVAASLFEITRSVPLFFCLWGAGAAGGVAGLFLKLVRPGNRRARQARPAPRSR